MEAERYKMKLRYLESYREKRIRLVALCARRDEFRDLRHSAEDLGVPVQSGSVGDVTGNTAAKLVDDLGKIQVDIDRIVKLMKEVDEYINSAPGEVNKLILILRFIRGWSCEDIAKLVSDKTGKPHTKQSIRKRIRRIIENLPELK